MQIIVKDLEPGDPIFNEGLQRHSLRLIRVPRTKATAALVAQAIARGNAADEVVAGRWMARSLGLT
jgi:hypothetical protein